MSDLLILVPAVGLAFICVLNWRMGILICLGVGFAADPLRKLVPGEPVYFSGMVILMIGATLVGTRLGGSALRIRSLFGVGKVLRLPLILFVVLVLVQSFAAYARTGSPVIAGIGLVAYFAPIAAVLLGSRYFRSTKHLERFMRAYVVFVVLMASGIILARMGYQWDVLQPVGEGLFAFSPSGERLDLQSGFFRASEVAAWHTTTAICFLVLLLVSKRVDLVRFLPIVGTMIFLAVALLFTGRRKGIAEVIVFLLVFLAAMAYFRRGAIRTSVVLVVLAICGVVVAIFTDLGSSLGIFPYYQRGLTIGGQDLGRFEALAFGGLRFVVQRNGILGAGAGVGSQGAQHFGGGSAVVGPAAEGGLGKVLAELGVPGLFLVLWLGLAGLRHFWRVAKRRSSARRLMARYSYGVIGLVTASVLTFAIAHQIFGDPFVLFVLGVVTGFLFTTEPAPRRVPPHVVRDAYSAEWETVPGPPR